MRLQNDSKCWQDSRILEKFKKKNYRSQKNPWFYSENTIFFHRASFELVRILSLIEPLDENGLVCNWDDNKFKHYFKKCRSQLQSESFFIEKIGMEPKIAFLLAVIFGRRKS